MEKFYTELRQAKDSLADLSPQEREARVLELRDGILSDEDIRQLGMREIPVPQEVSAAYKRYKSLLARGQREKA